MRQSLIWLMFVIITAPSDVLLAQTPIGSGEDSPATEPQSAPKVELFNFQQQILRDYERFEKSLYDIAEQSRLKDPERSELLFRARSQSQEARIQADMELIAKLLSPQTEDGVTKPARLGPAADRQVETLTRLKTVLKLLQSLDERSRIDSEIKRLEKLLKNANRLIASQKDVRADTQRGRQTENDQEKVAGDAKKLADEIDQQDKERNGDEKTDGQSTDSEQSKSRENGQKSESQKSESDGEKSKDDKKPGETDSKNGDQENGDKEKTPMKGGEPQKSQGKQSQGSPMESEGQPSDQQSQKGEQQQQSGQPQQGQQSEGAPKPQEEKKEQTPGREQLEKAREQMQRAIEELEKENKDKAVEQQDQAVARLEEMKAELERILRQLREEERETYLTLLEARFQNMLKRQESINNETVRLNKIPEEDHLQQNYASQTDTIRKEQVDNALDAEKALNLLREEGSSVAFPEAVEQMLNNMRVVEQRLGKYDTGGTTQLVENLILETLKEMIAAFQKEIEDQQKKDQQQQQNQQQQGEPQDPSLVNQIAELKMIRSLQLQVNRLTKQIGTEVVGNPDSDQQQLLDDLSQRQLRIQEATYDLSVGKNR